MFLVRLMAGSSCLFALAAPIALILSLEQKDNDFPPQEEAQSSIPKVKSIPLKIDDKTDDAEESSTTSTKPPATNCHEVCSFDEYCQLPIGQCTGSNGHCVRNKVNGGLRNKGVVCGCSGETFQSPAHAARAGVNIEFYGECKRQQKGRQKLEKDYEFGRVIQRRRSLFRGDSMGAIK